jgi:diadenosine tetraphosphate (Ap4A) HIT family hydrolase
VVSVFTRIITGELPGRIVWRDREVVAMLTIEPINPGHTLVIPVREVDDWTTLDAETWQRLSAVTHIIGGAIAAAFDAPRVGQMIAGFEVPHVHVHLFPAYELGDIGFDRVDRDPDPADLDEAARRLRAALRDMGQAERVPSE